VTSFALVEVSERVKLKAEFLAVTCTGFPPAPTITFPTTWLSGMAGGSSARGRTVASNALLSIE
jgi:hypothetical protein